MTHESAPEAIQKIQLALRNLRVSPDLTPHLTNYIHNLIITVVSDPEFRKQLNDNPTKAIEAFSKL